MKNVFSGVVLCLFLFMSTSAVSAHEDGWHANRPDGHAPIGVMGDHTHRDGEWMTSYRYMTMNMEGNRRGDDAVSTGDILSDFMVAPLEMQMEMHMLGVMYAPSDQLTLMLMVPYVRKQMDHRTRMGVNFETRTDGIGDVRFSGLFELYESEGHRVHLNAGVGLPTGSIRERGDTPAVRDGKLPYPMQLGSGTLDLLPGITYTGQSEHFSWGTQAGATFRTGTNAENYRLGHGADATGWAAVKLYDWLSFSGRFAGSVWGDINGFDPDLNPGMVPTADPRRRGGARLDAGVGLNIYAPEGKLEGMRLAVEALWPVYQDLEGPQLETDWTLTVGAQASF